MTYCNLRATLPALQAAPRPTNRAARFGIAIAFLAGLAISVACALRSQVGPDQWSLLIRGWLLVHGEWIHYGMKTSAGGFAPGSLTSLLFGLPMFAWFDYRAPILPIILSQVVAYLLIDSVLRKATGTTERLLFTFLYWLSPWRVYFSGFLWNPNYMLFVGAVHFWTSWRMRERPRFLETMLHVAIIGLGFELHLSAVVLVGLSLLLFWRGHVKVSWAGAACGAAIVALSLVPWLLMLDEARRVGAAAEGFPGRGLVFVFPVLRGIGYWLRYASLMVAERITLFDFTAALGTRADAILSPLFRFATTILAPATLFVALFANVRLLRRWTHRAWHRSSTVLPARAWIHAYVLLSLATALLNVAISPTTVMMWQLLPLFHAAVLPAVLWAGLLLRSRRHALRARQGAIAFVALQLLLVAAIAVASPMYRKGGRSMIGSKPIHDHLALHELGVTEHCGTAIVTSGGYVADVLREQERAIVIAAHPRAKPPLPDSALHRQQ